MAETFMRQWAMLRRIPKTPRKIDTGALKTILEDEGYTVDKRTIQRDLKTLSALFPLYCDERSKPFGWTWTGKDVFDVPGMEPQTALAFDMSEQFMRRMLPGSTLHYLQPYISRAHNVLNQLSELSEIRQWTKKLKVIPRGLTLMPAEVKPEVVDVVYEALLIDKRFKASYKKRDGQIKAYQLNPLGLVVRDNITYLIASVADYDNPLQFVLHRFQSAELVNQPRTVPKSFDLDAYVADGKLGYTNSDEPVKIILRFDSYVAQHLLETPLSEDQKWVEEAGGTVLIEASVLDNLELRWWLQGFGSKVEVLKPASLREEFTELARNMMARYLMET